MTKEAETGSLRPTPSNPENKRKKIPEILDGYKQKRNCNNKERYETWREGNCGVETEIQTPAFCLHQIPSCFFRQSKHFF